MNEAQIKAIANADTHATNAGLPSYTELLASFNARKPVAAADEWKATPHPMESGKWAVSCLNVKGQRNHVMEGVGIMPLVRAFDSRVMARVHADGLNNELTAQAHADVAAEERAERCLSPGYGS